MGATGTSNSSGVPLTVLHLRPSGPGICTGCDHIQMPRVHDCCVGETTNPLNLSMPVNLPSIWFSRKLLPCLALPHTEMVHSGPAIPLSARRASCPTSHLFVLSLKPISSRGWPCAAAAFAGSAEEPLLNQDAMSWCGGVWRGSGACVCPQDCWIMELLYFYSKMIFLSWCLLCSLVSSAQADQARNEV